MRKLKILKFWNKSEPSNHAWSCVVFVLTNRILKQLTSWPTLFTTQVCRKHWPFAMHWPRVVLLYNFALQNLSNDTWGKWNFDYLLCIRRLKISRGTEAPNTTISSRRIIPLHTTDLSSYLFCIFTTVKMGQHLTIMSKIAKFVKSFYSYYDIDRA